MAQQVSQVMTPSPVCLPPDTTIAEAARLMRDQGIGDVLVTEGDMLLGILTDRDIVIRAIAESRDPKSTPIGECCTPNIVTVSPDDDADSVVWLMRERAVRRVPVINGGKPIGIVSIGDMAMERDGSSALSDISAAPANK